MDPYCVKMVGVDMKKGTDLAIAKILADRKRKRVATAVFAPLLAGVIILTVILSIHPGFTQDANGYSSDLSEFVTKIEILDTSNQVLDPETSSFTLGQDYLFRINCTQDVFKAPWLKYDQGGNLTYQLPSEIKVLAAETDKPILMSGNQVGTYNINTDGAVTVQFNGIEDLSTITSFWLELSGQFTESGENIALDFGNKTTITVTVDEPPASPTASLKVDKQAGAYNPVNETISFSIQITAQDGDVDMETLIDTMDYQNHFYQVPFSAYGSSIAVNAPDGITYRAPVSTAAGFDIDFSGTLKKNDTITVTYTVQADQLDKLDLTQRTYSYNIWNKAAATGKDGESAEANVWGDISFTRVPMYKTANPYDGGAAWTGWLVGDGSTPLNGSAFTDTLNGLQFDTDQTVPIAFYGPGSVLISQSSVNLAAGDTSFAITVPGANDEKPGGGTYGTIVYVEVGRYTTSIADLAGYTDGKYSNTISVDMSGIPDTVVNTTVPNGVMSYVKSSQVVDGYIDWTIVWNIPKSMYMKPVWLDDFLTIGDYRVQNIPQDLVVTTGDGTTLARGTDYTIISPANYSSATDGDYSSPDGGYLLDNGWFLYFITQDQFDNPPPASAFPSSIVNKFDRLKYYDLCPFENGATLTITYKTPLDAPLVAPVDGGPQTLQDLLAQSEYSVTQNKACANYINAINPPLYYDYVNTGWVKGPDVYAQARYPIFKTGAQVSNGVYNYTVTLDLDRLADVTDPVFSDTFDSYLEYVPGSLKVDNNLYPWSSDGDDLLTASGNTLSFHFSDLKTNTGGTYQAPATTAWTGQHSVTYQLRVKDPDAMPVDQVTLHNTAGIQAQPGDGSGPNDFTYTNGSDQTYGKKVVVKDMTTQGNTATASIEINPDGKKLKDGPGTLIEATDKMSNMSFYFTTILFYTQDASGNYTVVHQPVFTDPGVLWSVVPVDDSSASLFIPDCTPVKIVYQTRIDANAGQIVDLENDVWVVGHHANYSNKNFAVSASGAGVSVASGEVTLCKNDLFDPSIHPQGAKFALYINTTYSGYNAVTPPAGVSPTITVGGVTYYYMTTSETDATGMARFVHTALRSDSTYIYALVEYVTPPGYLRPDSPTLFSYVNTPGAKWVTDMVFMDNTPVTASAQINVRKTLTGATSTQDKFTFDLVQVADKLGTPLSPLYTPQTSTHTQQGAGDFSFTVTNLSANTYYFKIAEKAGSDGWVYDQNTYLVKVTAELVGDELKTQVTYLDTGGNPTALDRVTFSNKALSGDILPYAGGTGATWFVVAAALFLLIALNVLIYWRSRRRSILR